MIGARKGVSTGTRYLVGNLHLLARGYISINLHPGYRLVPAHRDHTADLLTSGKKEIRVPAAPELGRIFDADVVLKPSHPLSVLHMVTTGTATT